MVNEPAGEAPSTLIPAPPHTVFNTPADKLDASDNPPPASLSDESAVDEYVITSPTLLILVPVPAANVDNTPDADEMGDVSPPAVVRFSPYERRPATSDNVTAPLLPRVFIVPIAAVYSWDPPPVLVRFTEIDMLLEVTGSVSTIIPPPATIDLNTLPSLITGIPVPTEVGFIEMVRTFGVNVSIAIPFPPANDLNAP